MIIAKEYIIKSGKEQSIFIFYFNYMIKCVICKAKIDSVLIFDGKSLIHYYTTHGLEPLDLLKIIKIICKKYNVK